MLLLSFVLNDTSATNSGQRDFNAPLGFVPKKDTPGLLERKSHVQSQPGAMGFSERDGVLWRVPVS